GTGGRRKPGGACADPPTRTGTGAWHGGALYRRGELGEKKEESRTYGGTDHGYDNPYTSEHHLHQPLALACTAERHRWSRYGARQAARYARTPAASLCRLSHSADSQTASVGRTRPHGKRYPALAGRDCLRCPLVQHAVCDSTA